jgi:4'-phosphopantetheinyl transferase EntD
MKKKIVTSQRYVDMEEAQFLYWEKTQTKITRNSIKNYCKRYKIGYQIGARWFVKRDKLEAMLDGKNDKFNRSRSKKGSS